MSKRKSTKHCCFVLFCGAPLVAITGQVGTDRLHIPVVNTMMAKGILPMDDKYSLWTIGIPQKDYVSQLFDRADLVIAIGYDIVECAPAKWVARPDMTIPLFLFHLSLKAALPCRVTKKDASRSIFCTFLFVLCHFYF